MEVLGWYGFWGHPFGLAVFFAGLGVLLWGVGQLKRAEVAAAQAELEERRYNNEQKRARDS
jgi:hypothetical protein